MTRDEMLQHKGHFVTMILNEEDPNGQITGILVDIDMYGETAVDTGKPMLNLAWPALRLECHNFECM